jgi:NAD(P)-dependent dehydrogenase (short-subunit alcohol dehydrogenase family)
MRTIEKLMSLKDKVVVITGGAGLLGAQFVKAVLEQGSTAIIAETDIKRANKLKEHLISSFPSEQVAVHEMDITSKHSIINTIDSLHLKFERIDAVINNAYPKNKNYGRHFFEVEYKDFSENLGLNLGGYFLVAQQFAKYFVKQGWGNIINIASIYGVVAPQFDVYENTTMTMPVEYAAIKSGLIHLTKYIAKYFKGKNIRVNSLSIGGILDQQPDNFLAAYRDKCLNKGMLLPEDIIGSLIFLLSNQSQFVNGQNLIVDDGFVL